MLLSISQVVPLITLVPRFVLSLRALYARDLRGIRTTEIDSAFGFSSGSTYSTAASTLVFSDGGENGGIEQAEEIELIGSAREDHGTSGA